MTEWTHGAGKGIVVRNTGKSFALVKDEAGPDKLGFEYLDGPDFQKFWDIDGTRTDEAVISIGKQG